MWSLAGLILAVIVASVSWRLSRSKAGLYDPHSYGMNAPVHRTYAAVSLAFAAFFGVTYFTQLGVVGVVGLALYALIAIFYATSFLRGATHE